VHFQYTVVDEEVRWDIIFEHETPFLILWKTVEDPLEDIRPTYRYSTGEK